MLRPSRVSGKLGTDYWFRGVANDTVLIRLTPGSYYEFGAFIDLNDIPFIRIVWPTALPGPIVAEATKDPAGPLVVRPQEPQPIPTVPGKTDRPQMGDWAIATPVNAAARERRPKTCEALVLRDWVKWRCSGGYLFLAGTTGFGKLGEDHFMTNTTNLMEGESRLVPGMAATAKIEFDIGGPKVEFRATWREGEPGPTEISFQTVQK